MSDRLIGNQVGFDRSDYQTVVADPPWPYHSSDLKAAPDHRPNTWDGPTGGVAAKERYGLMTMADIKALPVRLHVAENAHLYLWTTNSFMVEAHDVAKAWGFEPKTIITWAKVKQDGVTPSMKMGYWYRSATEHCLFAVRGKLRLLDKVCFPTFFLHGRLPHSVKPESFFAMVEAASPAPRLEMFARRRRAGWYAWGNEVPAEEPMTLGLSA